MWIHHQLQPLGKQWGWEPLPGGLEPPSWHRNISQSPTEAPLQLGVSAGPCSPTNHHMGPVMQWARLTHTHRPSICIPTGWNRNAIILTEHCPAIDVSRLPPVFTFDKCLSFGSHPPSSWGLLYRDNLLFHCHSVRCLKRIIGRYFCSLDVKK